MTIGARIEGLCNEKGLSKYRLSKISGVSTGAISEIVAGERNPTKSTLVRISSALGVTLAELFAGVDLNSEDFDVLTDGTVTSPNGAPNHKVAEIAKRLYRLSDKDLRIIDALIKEMEEELKGDG